MYSSNDDKSLVDTVGGGDIFEEEEEETKAEGSEQLVVGEPCGTASHVPWAGAPPKAITEYVMHILMSIISSCLSVCTYALK